MSFAALLGLQFKNPLDLGPAPRSTTSATRHLRGVSKPTTGPSWARQLHRKAKDHTFAYTVLHFIPGAVTFCRLADIPVITGPMAGGYLFSFRQGGAPMVAHVGVGDQTAGRDNSAGQIWSAHVARPDVSEVFGCKPEHDIASRTRTGLRICPDTFDLVGFWEPDGTAYLGALSPGRTRKDPVKLVHVQRAKPRPWSEIQAQDAAFVPPDAWDPKNQPAAAE